MSPGFGAFSVPKLYLTIKVTILRCALLCLSLRVLGTDSSPGWDTARGWSGPGTPLKSLSSEYC